MSAHNPSRLRVALVHNFATHYTERTFRLLGSRFDTRLFFFSRGNEPFWLSEHGVRNEALDASVLPGMQVGRTRLTPTLPFELLRGRFDAVVKCINGRFALPATFATARLAGIPFVLWTGLWEWPDTPAHRLARPAARAICRGADAVVTYGAHVRRFLISEGVDERRIFVAPHAVENERYSRKVPPRDLETLRSRFGIGDRPIVLYVGRLRPEKGLGDLLHGFARAAGAPHLLLAGVGPEDGRLRDLVRTLGLEQRVHFPGYVTTEETVRLYAAADVLVLPSITTPTFKEPWGLVVNEAFNQNVPVIATTAVGAAAGGLVEHEQTGLVVPEGSPELLGDAVARILSDADLRNRLSRNAGQRIAGWTQERMVGAFADAIQFAVARRRG